MLLQLIARTHLSFIIITIFSVIWTCTSFQKMDLSSYPSMTRTAFLHNFTNNTFQADINRELTEITRDELNRRNNFRLQGKRETARLWIYGNITVYRKEGLMYDNMRNAIRNELIVVCKIKMRQNPGKITSPPGIQLLESREIIASVMYSEKQGYRETEFSARQRLLRILARRINSSLEKAYSKYFSIHQKKSVKSQ